MKVAVIGMTGQLGGALMRAFESYEVTGTARRDPEPGHVTLDLASPPSIPAALHAIRPDVVLLAAAMCHVDGCEQDPGACSTINVEGTRAVAEWARVAGARVVFFSTDHVFDGAAPDYDEDAPVTPLNEYAKSKARAEAVLRETLAKRHLVLRTAWLYGPDRARRNFALRLVARLTAGESMPVPTDQWGAPTYTDDLAAITRHLVEHDAVGTFHATGPELVDRLTLAHRICARFKLDAAGLVPTTTAALAQPAPRPLRVLLRGERLAATGAPRARGVEEGLAALHRWASRAAS